MRQVSDRHLEEMLGMQQILEAMFTQIDQCSARWQVVNDEPTCRLRKQDLTTMPCRSNPCRAVDIQPNIAFVTPPWLAGVQPHARRDGDANRPRMSCQCPLN